MAKLTELANERDKAHVHVASTSHRRLVDICDEWQRRGGHVSDFAGYDHVDCVHVDPGSWHYRCPKSPDVSRSCEEWRRECKHNLAADLNGLTATKRAEMFTWIERKYGRPSGWYVP